MFIDGAAGALFCNLFPRTASHGVGNAAVIFLPPFGEEMNRSRRMAALLARALSAAGSTTMLIDPHGTGDSAGTLETASWQLWIEDARLAIAWLRRQGHDRLHLVGLRTGANLALAAADGAVEIAGIVLWQPVAQGGLFLQQLLRVRVAGGLSVPGASNRGESTRELRARLSEGESLEIAGYPLTGAMARSIEELDLASSLQDPGPPVHWIEIAGDASSGPPPASARVLELLAAGRRDCTYLRIAGDQFWAIEEPALVPDLISGTVGLLTSASE